MSEPEKNSDSDLDFEQALTELEALVESLERGDLSLEDSLAAFERGVSLTRSCQAALKQAEQKVEVLSRDGDGAELSALDPDDDADT